MVPRPSAVSYRPTVQRPIVVKGESESDNPRIANLNVLVQVYTGLSAVGAVLLVIGVVTSPSYSPGDLSDGGFPGVSLPLAFMGVHLLLRRKGLRLISAERARLAPDWVPPSASDQAHEDALRAARAALLRRRTRWPGLMIVLGFVGFLVAPPLDTGDGSGGLAEDPSFLAFLVMLSGVIWLMIAILRHSLTKYGRGSRTSPNRR